MKLWIFHISGLEEEDGIPVNGNYIGRAEKITLKTIDNVKRDFCAEVLKQNKRIVNPNNICITFFAELAE